MQWTSILRGYKQDSALERERHSKGHREREIQTQFSP